MSGKNNFMPIPQILSSQTCLCRNALFQLSNAA